MATVSEALGELGIKEWVLRGEPTKESEFKEMFRKVTGADENGSAIETSFDCRTIFICTSNFSKHFFEL